MNNTKFNIANNTKHANFPKAGTGTTAEHFTGGTSSMNATPRMGRLQKLFMKIFTLAVICVMCGAFGYQVDAAVTPPEVDERNRTVSVGSLEEFDYVYEHLADYKNQGVLVIKYWGQAQTTLTRNYDFGNLGVNLYNTTVSKGASVQTTNVLVFGSVSGENLGTLIGGIVQWEILKESGACANVNNGTIICTGMQKFDHDFEIIGIHSDSGMSGVDFTNNGTIIMKNTGIINLQRNSLSLNSFINSDTGVIENKAGQLLTHGHTTYGSNNYGSVYEDAGVETTIPATNNGIVRRIITDPATTGGSDVTLAATTIPAPTYTVTIPKAIAFGDCEKKLANDTEANKIKTITMEELKLIHSNLFANEKKVTVTMGSDFLIKSGESSLVFELYDGENKLATNTTLLTANPTEVDNDTTQTKTLTAKLDQSKIKKSGTYTGTVNFTVAMADAE